jgi:hypothetical protein
MTQSAVNSQRFDPYKNFKFRLWDGERTYTGDQHTGLVPRAEVVKYRAGGDHLSPHKSPGRNKYESITLERGVTQDPNFGAWAGSLPEQGKYPSIPLERGVTQDSGFSNWASKVWNYESSLGGETSSGKLRKNLLVELRDEAGQPVVSFTVNQHGVLETPALPPRKVVHHVLHLHGHGSIQEQLALIFESSLRRLRP